MQKIAEYNDKDSFQLFLFDPEREDQLFISVSLDAACSLLPCVNLSARTIDDNCACEPG